MRSSHATLALCPVSLFLLASAAGLLHPTPVPQDEFTAGVSELCKAKLEKPKRLSELAGRWWNEIYAGTYLFDRQVRPTALGVHGAASCCMLARVLPHNAMLTPTLNCVNNIIFGGCRALVLQGIGVVAFLHAQVAEVEVLKTLTQLELVAFAQEVLGAQSPARRKLAVLIRGSREFADNQQSSGSGTCPADATASGSSRSTAEEAAAADGTCSATDAAGVCSSSSSSGADCVAYVSTAVPEGERFLVIQDVSAFKRGCELWPTAGQQHSKQLQQQHRRQAIFSGQGTAAAADGTGEAAAAAQSEEGLPGAAKL